MYFFTVVNVARSNEFKTCAEFTEVNMALRVGPPSHVVMCNFPSPRFSLLCLHTNISHQKLHQGHEKVDEKVREEELPMLCRNETTAPQCRHFMPTLSKDDDVMCFTCISNERIVCVAGLFIFYHDKCPLSVQCFKWI